MMFSIVLTSQIYANEFKVGFAELSITPNLIDEWEDINNDAQFDPDIDKCSLIYWPQNSIGQKFLKNKLG